MSRFYSSLFPDQMFDLQPKILLPLPGLLGLHQLPYCRGRFLVRPRVASKRRNGGHTDTSVLVALSSIGMRRKATSNCSLNPFAEQMGWMKYAHDGHVWWCHEAAGEWFWEKNGETSARTGPPVASITKGAGSCMMGDNETHTCTCCLALRVDL